MPGIPVIAIPTTSGTGSEVSPGGVLIDVKKKEKVNFISRHVMPRMAIIDPELAQLAPTKVAAASGLDALAHAVESYTSRRSSPLTDPYCSEAIRLIGSSLRRAVWARFDMAAITQVALASLFAGIGMSNAGGAAAHALAYPIGAKYHLAHGASVGMLLGPVTEFNSMSDVGKYARVAELLSGRPTRESPVDSARRAGVLCRELALDVGLVKSLRDIGVDELAIPTLAEEAVAITRLIDNNPRPVTVGDAKKMYESLM